MTTAAAEGDAAAAVEAAYRAHWGRLLALLTAQLRRLDLAEDSLQEAFAIAAVRWEGAVPANPAGWLLTTARRRAVDRLRSEAAAARRLPRLIVDDPAARHPVEERVEERLMGTDDLPDERLRMVFACCHPALSPPARVALTLRYVSGLQVPQIARLLLVAEPTMAARITRAKKKIAAAGIPFRVPPRDRLAARLDVVLAAVYLTFTEGYAATAGPHLLRDDLAAEAIRLSRLLVDLLPEDARVRALLALLLLQHARRGARVDAGGDLVLLPDQDRGRYDRTAIAEGLTLLDDLTGADPEPYLLQARIAAEHSRPASAADTDWPSIAAHYAVLEALTGSPVVRLNRAVAVAEAEGPLAGLELLTGLDDALPRSHRLPAVRGELWLRAGDADRARQAFDRALQLVGTDVERAHLQRRRDACPPPPGLPSGARGR